MGIARGPRIVRDKLLVHFDAASPRSYVDPSSTWNDLTDIDSPYSASEVGTITWDSGNGGSFDMDGSGANFWDCGLVPFDTSSYTKICVFSPKGVRNHNLISDNIGEHAFWLDSSITVISAGHDALYTTINANVGDMSGKWNWAAQTFDSTTGFQIYYNGELVASSSDTTSMTATPEVKIGSWNGSSANNISGSIAIAMIYNKVLSDEEMLQNYNAVKRRFNLP